MSGGENDGAGSGADPDNASPETHAAEAGTHRDEAVAQTEAMVPEARNDIPSAIAPVPRPVPLVDLLLAGLQSGMLGALWMLAWVGLTSIWQRRTFWTVENLIATAFHPGGPILTWFGSDTVSGLALFLLLYSLLGGLFAMVAWRKPLRPARSVLVAVIFALVWYYFSFHVIWPRVAPALAFLHSERATIVGHLIYGVLLGRFYAHLPSDREYSISGTRRDEPVDSLTPNA